MIRYVLVLLLALLLLAPDPAPAAPAAAGRNATELLLLDYPKVPRPVYKRYRGNSRAKRKHFWWYRRWRARRQAMRKHKAAPAHPAKRGVIRVEAPAVQMPAPPPAPKP